MQIPVSQFIIASKDNIAEKPLKKFCGLINVFIKVIVICAHQGISEIPGIFFKRRIVYIYSKGLQILDDEYGCRSGVSFRKRVDLPDTGSKSGNVFNKILLVKAVVFKGFFLFKIIIQRWHDISVITVNYGIIIEHPFFFRNIVCSKFSGFTDDALKQMLVDLLKGGGGEGECFIAQQLGDSGGNNVGFFFFRQFVPFFLFFVISADPGVCRIEIYFSFNVISGCIQKIFRCFQSIHVLQTDGHFPGVGFFNSAWIVLFYIFIQR